MYILASASPRRKELFSRYFKDFKIIPSSVEETIPKNITAEKTPEYLAILKAKDIFENYPNDIVIGADTAVVIDGKILGKPTDKKEAVKMLEMLSGRTHKVITGCAICKNGSINSFSEVTEVEFYTLSKSQIIEYTNMNEPYDKAGGYGIQSYGGLFVKAIKGDYYNVVGLPIARLVRFLNEI